MIAEYNLIHRNDCGRLDLFALVLHRVRERYDFIDGFVVVIRTSKRVWCDLTSNYRRGAPDKTSLTMCHVTYTFHYAVKVYLSLIIFIIIVSNF